MAVYQAADLSRQSEAASDFDFQGHMGARGLIPENTLPSFAKALSLGVATLELDVGVTKDGVVVVSQGPRLHPALARGPDGKWLAGAGPAIRSLTFAELKAYDVGRLNPKHEYSGPLSHQEPLDGTRIPSLAEVIALTRKAGNDKVWFNVEIKLSPVEPHLALEPEAFADALLAVLRKEGVANRASIQSFDWRVLQYVQRVAPDIPTVYLSAQQDWLDNIQKGQPGPSAWTAGFDVDDHGGSVPRLIKAAGGKIWSPDHTQVDAAQLREAHDLGIEVVVWVVNDPTKMSALIDLGVDGIISDYPDRLRRVLKEKGVALPAPTPVEP